MESQLDLRSKLDVEPDPGLKGPAAIMCRYVHVTVPCPVFEHILKLSMFFHSCFSCSVFLRRYVDFSFLVHNICFVFSLDKYLTFVKHELKERVEV
jgi:hypothetical protein